MVELSEPSGWEIPRVELARALRSVAARSLLFAFVVLAWRFAPQSFAADAAFTSASIALFAALVDACWRRTIRAFARVREQDAYWEHEAWRAARQSEKTSGSRIETLARVDDEIGTSATILLHVAADLLADEPDAGRRRSLEMVLRSGERIGRALGDLADVRKLDRRAAAAEARAFDLRSVVEETVERFEVAAEQAENEIVLRWATGTPRGVVGDERRLREAVADLVSTVVASNAGKSILVDVETLIRSGERADLRLSIGAGGVAALATRAGAHPEAPYGGRVAASPRAVDLVEDLGGTVHADADENGAIRFRAILPFQIDGRAEPAPPPATLRDVPVLVVDPSAVCRATLSRDLADLGLRPVAVASGAAGLAAVREAAADRNSFAIAIVAEELPDMTLEELGARIHGAANGASPRTIGVAPLRSILDGTHAGRGGDGWLARPVTSRALLQALAGALAPLETAAPAVSFEEPRILVVEDDPVTRDVVVKSLERLGYRADTAENGREAVTRLSGALSALVLMDCEMPEMDGFQATAEIRRAEARSGRHVPIVAMTAAVADDDRPRCLASGMDDFLAKPVTLASLAAALGRWLPVETVPDLAVRRLSADERSAVDRAVIDDLRALAAEHEPGFVAALVERFLKDAPHRLSRLRDEAARGDVRALEVDAHALQSSTGNLGIRRMVEICRDIQVLGRSGRADAAAPLVEALEHEFYRAEPELERVRRV